MATASLTEVQLPTTRKSGSASSNRLRLSRNRLWSSTSRIRISGSMNLFPVARENRRQFHYKAGPLGLGLVAQVASKGAHEFARQIEPQSRRLCALLKRTEQPRGICDAASGIAKAHADSLLLSSRDDRQLPPRCAQQRSLAVLVQSDGDL